MFNLNKAFYLYQTQSFTGTELPAKTLCLTFDDGPGKHTADIARFLYENNIQATFFVVGKYAYHHPDILQQLKEMDHLVGNHTYEHPDIPYYVSVDGNIIDQVVRTDAVIKPYVTSNRVYFRAPYGKWSPEVAHELNRSILTANHIGPIFWEVAGIDCYYWQNNWPAEEAAARYLTDIEQQGRGIVVFHDEIADMDVVKPRNKTLELLKILVPQLLERGYQFVSLDEIPSIKETSTEKPTFTLRSKGGKRVSLKNKIELYAVGQAGNLQNLLTLEELGYGKVAIKAANNLYLSTAGETNNLTASAVEMNATETFDLIPVNATTIMLRCTNGFYVAIEKNGKLSSSAQFMRQAAIFSYANHNLAVKNSISLMKRFSLLKKRLLFVKSKLQQKISQ
ncbi:polysaccharide deacetylase family protein [Mucilaginibacter arboris]|uniref:Polysaccharide deacetylase family protein n=1 Tax=Mucilaginibacter arboris TaxID=2682090 RepID=A0A7K1SYS0_9SPHI|nr:polysaccharide deacetylase family protein [Mucilaginibacter arboris]MVN22474.1 polysaccharide deacetylase family protein [Mucilaginibacter arboris]